MNRFGISLEPDFSRRAALKTAVAGVGASVLGGALVQGAQAPQAGVKRYEMKKSINLWAFPYPEKWTLRQCLEIAKKAGFDGIELNYDLESELSPKSGSREFAQIRKMAEEIGIAISGMCSFLFWQYPLTSNDEAKRSRGIELAGKIAQAAHDLGTENVLVVPGAVEIPWRTDHEPVPNDVCDKRAREAIGKLLPSAEKLKVYLNIENIFFNGYLMTPM
jgi:hexulose-6-phosphate isomerase